MKRRPGILALALVAATASLAACGSRAIDLSGACPQLDTRAKVPTCTSLFDDPVGLKLPAGPKDAPIGAISRAGGAFVASDGTTFKLPPLKNVPATTNTAYATTVYQATVKDGVATRLRPLLRVSEGAILAHTFGAKTLAGVISTRLPDGSYDMRAKLPVVIRLEANASGKTLHGTVANADRSVRVGHDTCIDALSKTSANPLVDGFTKNISLERVPSMHVPHDDELVLLWTESSTGMGNSFYPSVATAMGHDDLGRTWDVMQHGNPTSGPELRLHLTDEPVANC